MWVVVRVYWCLCFFPFKPSEICMYIHEWDPQMNSLRLFSMTKIANQIQKCACVSACKINTHTHTFTYVRTILFEHSWALVRSFSIFHSFIRAFVHSLTHPFHLNTHDVPTHAYTHAHMYVCIILLACLLYFALLVFCCCCCCFGWMKFVPHFIRLYEHDALTICPSIVNREYRKKEMSW